MKKSLRIASAALALTLAASCAVPAFAAGSSSFSKDETVYAVMNGDGSIKSTTVSEHLYNAGGLSSVTDKSTLTDIQNTESSAEFTQNGDELVWNTDDTDVYYKGSTDKTLPMDVKVTYALDGQEAALEDLIGKSGHLTVTVSLKNNETGTVEVNGQTRSIVTPLITAVGVILGSDASNVTAEHGVVESAAKSNVAAFVTLPGVKDSLSGLLPDEVNSIEDYLQDTVTVEADVTELTCPQIMVACATSTEALGTDNVFDLSSITELTDGMTQLNDAMSAEIAFSCPRLRPIINNDRINPMDVHEPQLLQVVCAYRLFMPFASITVSTRECARVRDNLVGIAATKISAGVSTGIGSHVEDIEDKGDDQFEISDGRSVDEVYKALLDHDLQPVMNDYVYL